MSLACCTDGDQASVVRVEYRKARVTHRCCGCRAEIATGDEYRHHSELFEGYWSTWKHCETCASLLGAFWEVGLCADPEDVPGAYSQYLRQFVPATREAAGVFRLQNGRTIDEQVDRVFPPEPRGAAL